MPALAILGDNVARDDVLVCIGERQYHARLSVTGNGIEGNQIAVRIFPYRHPAVTKRFVELNRAVLGDHIEGDLVVVGAFLPAASHVHALSVISGNVVEADLILARTEQGNTRAVVHQPQFDEFIVIARIDLHASKEVLHGSVNDAHMRQSVQLYAGLVGLSAPRSRYGMAAEVQLDVLRSRFKNDGPVAVYDELVLDLRF